MAEGLLPPAVAEFIADASEWITGIDEMIAANDRLLESIAKVDAAAKDSTLAGSVGGAEAGAAGAAANSEAAGAATAAADADRDLADAEAEAATYAERMAAMQREVVDAAGAAADAQLRVADTAKEAGLGTDAYTAALDESTTASLRLMDAQIRLGQAELAAAGHAEEAGAEQDVAGTETEAAGEKAKTSTGHFKLLALGLAAGAIASIKMAGDFQQSMTRLVTSAGESEKNISMVSKGILQLSVSTNTSASQLAKGMYYVESAGFHAASGLTVLKAAAEGAQAEGADLGTVANAVTSALNSYGLKAGSAMKVTDEMVTAVGRGKMTMQDFAGSLAAVLPVAAAAHVGFAQVGGAIATMTSQGMSAQWAAQDLRHTMVALQNPNNVQIQEMQQLGVNSISLAKNLGKEGLTGTINELEHATLVGMGKSGLVLLKSFNQSKLAAKSAQEEIAAMPPTIRKVAEAYSEGKVSAAQWQAIVYKGGESTLMKNLLQQFATTENAAKGFNTALKSGNGDAQTFTAAMAKMMGGQVGLQTALMVGGGHMATYDANVKAIGKSANETGSNVNNWGLIQKNFNFQLGQAGKSVEAMAISFGKVLLPAATGVMHAFAAFAALIARNAIACKALALVVGVLLAGAIEHGLAKALGTSLSGLKSMGKMLGLVRTETEATAAATDVAATAEEGVTVATEGSTGAFAAFTAALDINPVMLIITAIVALAIGLYELYKHCKAVRDVVADVGHFFSGLWTAAMHLAGDAVKWFVNGPLVWIKQQTALFSKFWAQHGQEIEEIAKAIWSVVSSIIKAYLDVIVTEIKVAFAIISAVVKIALDLIRILFVSNWDIISAVVKTALSVIGQEFHMAFQLILGIIGIALDLITGHWSKAGHDLEALTSEMFHDVINIIKTITSGFGELLVQAGKNLIEGLISGIKSMVGAAVSAAKSVGSAVVSGIKGLLGISSPSTVMRDIGEQIAAGLIKGLEGTASQVKSSAEKLATDIKDAVSAGMITAGQGDTYTRWMERDNNKLQSLANKRKTILNEIKTAQKYATSTTTAIEGDYSVTNAAGTGPATAASILATLKTDLTQIKQFKSNINKLAKMGLNKTYLNQLIQAGPIDGGPVAAELAAGSWAQIKEINSVESQIATQAKKLGRDAADDMYDSGKNAGKGFLTGLQSQQKALENEMKKLAKALVNSIKHELGIKSPSAVMRPHGQAVVDGLIVGIRDRMPQLDAAMKQVARTTGGALGTPSAGAGAIGSPTGVSTASQQQTLNLTLQMQWPTGEHLRKSDQKYTLRYNKRNGVNGLTLATTTTA